MASRSHLSKSQQQKESARFLALNRRLTAEVWKGRTVIEPKSDEVQIDLDGHRALTLHARQWFLIRAFYPPARRWTARFKPSKTRNHAHVTVKLPRRRPLVERVLLAALLGDDLKRSVFNYVRAMNGSKIPVAFFED